MYGQVKFKEKEVTSTLSQLLQNFICPENKSFSPRTKFQIKEEKFLNNSYNLWKVNIFVKEATKLLKDINEKFVCFLFQRNRGV